MNVARTVVLAASVAIGVPGLVVSALSPVIATAGAVALAASVAMAAVGTMVLALSPATGMAGSVVAFGEAGKGVWGETRNRAVRGAGGAGFPPSAFSGLVSPVVCLLV
jgi:hypothetical protein